MDKNITRRLVSLNMNNLTFILFITVTSGHAIISGPMTADNIYSERLIIDTDGGADDINAISLILAAWRRKSSKFEVIAITCTYGNTEERYVEKNVLELLTIVNTPLIPVYRGAQKSIAGNVSSDHYFGIDGFGDFKFEKIVTTKVDESMHGAVALVHYAKLHRGELNVITLGPLTNIALAISLDPQFVNNIKRFYIMGGSVNGIGNIEPGKEFNFVMDPISAFITFNSLHDKPCLLFPWDTVIIAGIPKKWRIEVLGTVNSEIIKFLNQGEAIALNYSSTIWSAADIMCAAVMMWPELITKNVTHNVSPIIDGEAQGAVMVDYANTSGKFKNAEIVHEFNVSAYKSKLIEFFS